MSPIRSYFRTLPDLYRRKALGIAEGASREHPAYTPEQFTAYVGVLCIAEQQRPRGHFASVGVLEALLAERPHGARYAREVAFLIEQGDLIVNEDGSVYVEGWTELQEGNWQVAERMRRYRERRNPQPAPVALDEDDPAVVYMMVTGSFPRGKAISWIDDLTREFGPERVRAAIASESETGNDGLLGRVTNTLRMQQRQQKKGEPKPEPRRGPKTDGDRSFFEEFRRSLMGGGNG